MNFKEILKSLQKRNNSIIFDKFIILTTLHTLYVAKLMSLDLESMGVRSKIEFYSKNQEYSENLYIAICPQFLENIPKKYIAFQMEQSISSRWFDDRYLKILKQALAIFDYSRDNILFLMNKKINSDKIFYYPIYPDEIFEADLVKRQIFDNYEYDILFYGDPTSKRRRELLESLSCRYKLKICSEIFGNELYNEILRSKIVINIHYYENALLETTRIAELISLNKVVVSECGCDNVRDFTYDELVNFVPVGDYELLVKKIDTLLSKGVYYRTVDYKALRENRRYYLRIMLSSLGLRFYER